jgi:hypothetical protein
MVLSGSDVIYQNRVSKDKEFPVSHKQPFLRGGDGQPLNRPKSRVFVSQNLYLEITLSFMAVSAGF